MTFDFNPPSRDTSYFARISSATARLAKAVACAAVALSLVGPLLPTQASAQTVTIIRNDHGGSVEERLRQIAALQASGTRVEIRGECASSCTMLLGLPNACVSRSARLGFHGPSSQYYGISLPPEEFEYWSQVMAEHYPAAISSWFMAEARMTTMGIVSISGARAISMGANPCT